MIIDFDGLLLILLMWTAVKLLPKKSPLQVFSSKYKTAMKQRFQKWAYFCSAVSRNWENRLFVFWPMLRNCNLISSSYPSRASNPWSWSGPRMIYNRMDIANCCIFVALKRRYITVNTFSQQPTGLRTKRDFRVKPCSPVKLNVTILHFLITGKTPPE